MNESKWLHFTSSYLSYSLSPPPLCGAIPASSDYVAKQGDKVAARVKAVDGDGSGFLQKLSATITPPTSNHLPVELSNGAMYLLSFSLYTPLCKM